MDPEDREQFKTLHEIYKPKQGAGTSLTRSAPALCSLPVAADRTRVLLGSYRKGDAEDPDVYTSAVAAVLAQYPEAIVKRVTDPRGGLPGTSQWLPTVHEVRVACEREMEPQRAEIRREAERSHTDKICGRSSPAESSERRKEVAENIRARLAASWSDPNAVRNLDPRSLTGPARLDAVARLEEQQREFVADWKVNPPTMSPHLRRLLGLPPRAEAAE